MLLAMRDDFKKTTKDTLANRVGNKCSNPSCRINTSGSNSNNQKATNTGVAAHITAASKNGPRFNPKLSKEDRVSISNGIWLCYNCSVLIDKDSQKFSVELLKKWKIISEYLSETEINRNSNLENIVNPSFTPSLQYKNAIEDFNKKIKKLIPNGIRNPKENNKLIPFESEKIILSLSTLNILIRVGFEILDSVYEKIKLLIVNTQIREISTSNIRIIISESLYTLDSPNHHNERIQFWADSYARKYGNPYILMKVIMENGNEVDFTYKFILDYIIADLIKKCYGCSIEDIRIELKAGKSLSYIAKEMLEMVRYLNLYAIDYETLLRLCYNICVQPPHPWLSGQSKKEENIKYNLGRASKHYFIIKNSTKPVNQKEITHSISELLEHTCSSLLIYYESFIGAGKNRVLNGLIRYLELLKKEDNLQIFKYSKIQQIKGDLAANGCSISELYRLITHCRNYSGKYKLDITEQKLIPVLIDFYSISTKLISNNQSFYKNLMSISNFKEFHQVIDIVFNSIEGFRIKKHYSKHSFFIHHLTNPIFKDFKIKIKIYPIYNSANFLEVINDISSDSKIEKYFNTVFFISNEKVNEKIKNEFKSSDLNIIIISLEDLIKIYKAKQRLKALEIYIENYLLLSDETTNLIEE